MDTLGPRQITQVAVIGRRIHHEHPSQSRACALGLGPACDLSAARPTCVVSPRHPRLPDADHGQKGWPLGLAPLDVLTVTGGSGGPTLGPWVASRHAITLRHTCCFPHDYHLAGCRGFGSKTLDSQEPQRGSSSSSEEADNQGRLVESGFVQGKDQYVLVTASVENLSELQRVK
jgi:hypothetical protein